VEVDGKNRISAFVEKPEKPKPMPGDGGKALASMGNYLFNRDVLEAIMVDESYQDPNFDFGKSILPDIHKKFKVYAYDFSTNILPGVKPYEEPAYWRDVGTIAAFYDANMDVLGARPRLNLNNRRWFIHSGSYDGAPAKVLSGTISNTIIGDGCFIRNATIKNSILGRGVHVHDNAVIEDSIVMDFCKVRADARLKRVIVDRWNEIAAKDAIGGNPEKDAQRFTVDAGGIVVIPRGKTAGRRSF
jgi:glucose-1-phosphate adenylyltransferase